MDNEKFQELVLKQLTALTEGQDSLTEKVTALTVGQESLTEKVDHIENRIDKLEIRMENAVIDKVRALFDAREVQNDINERIINALGRIEAKVDVLQMETASIRRVK